VASVVDVVVVSVGFGVVVVASVVDAVVVSVGFGVAVVASVVASAVGAVVTVCVEASVVTSEVAVLSCSPQPVNAKSVQPTTNTLATFIIIEVTFLLDLFLNILSTVLSIFSKAAQNRWGDILNNLNVRLLVLGFARVI
jgi:hypothetical protein